jgi:hypothetical protein
VQQGDDIPTVKANLSDVQIKEHEDHLFHFNYIHNEYDRVTGKNNGILVEGQMCYPNEWKNIQTALEGADITVLHNPTKGNVEGVKKEGSLTDKQKAQAEYLELFGFEAEESLTAATLKKEIKEIKEIDVAFKAEEKELARPVTLEQAREALFELK